MAGGIPISQVVSVTPSALSAGGGVAFINGLIITTNTTVVPAGTVVEYTSAPAVATAFGASSTEYQMAAVYFGGYTGASQTPSTLYFAGYTAPTTDTPSNWATYLTALIGTTQEFAGFTTTFEPELADKQAIATWVGEQKDRFWYVPWDTDTQATTQNSETAFGVWLTSQNIDGTTVVYQDPLVAAGCLGWMASLNFDTTNGRWDLCFCRFSGVTATVTDGTTASVLEANGYSFYGLHANGLGRFIFLRGGNVSGQFKWADSYINQIWLNASFQSDMLNLELSAGNIPFNTQGDALISASAQPTIDQGLAFGAIRAGVTLTDAEALEVNNAAGVTISDTLQTRGWYFQPNASTAAASVRSSRGPISPKFWYTDGQSVQSINLASVEVQ
ncbi:DUF3383 family protein [Gluconobacter kanchanaburiensis]|uniref:Uncharacterized protein n=1 Tax=Gluconobacter kanchanaburiensis NBRC 103587 TaxID=1307948 RepID=A0A511B638_9PROT|nr:DUF3383 family protein [Gluconobacter kanchanaburiensis]MBF0861277.1 DUF3383 family protein [Gluconobacter kanchanaburiensis]GBR71002.1 hypothetical protein AA103587_2167 [Gluconobacter kanchanaburiensis NBRC 103587]GEK95896.1 hypothetical protein GKA01_10930 [Gluconobacter kanchanaburiensis NBRC 103587]